MGCVQSTRPPDQPEEYVETLTLKRLVSKKPTGQNLQIQISVIADPMSSDDESGSYKYSLKRSKSRSRNSSVKTMSFAEGRRFTKFPNMAGYKMCRSCNENKQDVLKTVNPDWEKEICRKCSVHHRKESRKHRKKSKAVLNAAESKTDEKGDKKVKENEFDNILQLRNETSVSALQETVKKMDLAALASLLALVRRLL